MVWWAFQVTILSIQLAIGPFGSIEECRIQRTKLLRQLAAVTVPYEVERCRTVKVWEIKPVGRPR